ncbi:MAG: ABC transporter ATP-binding protein [Vulcanisaeta sp.]|jgi:ABC-2 type transport system ATP-binding protein|uniref:ABC transporter ATP-binding protein n=1 Tax=Vulcanisaeta sp. TaxID=2020871 RepID=UPI003D12B63C
MGCALRIEKLTIKYGSKVAVDGLSTCVRPGETYCLLGPNGAGKTSTIKAVLGLVRYEGHIDMLGMGPPRPEVMNKVGAVLETPLVLETLSPRDFLEFVGSVRGVRDSRYVEALVRALGLEEFIDRPIMSLSAGNRQKVAIIAALMHRPRLLLMDEPFNYLDAKSVRVVKELMQRHLESGGSILFTTHIMEVAERVCSRIGIINTGRLVMEGTPMEIMSAVNAGSLEDAFLRAIRAEDEIRGLLEGL